MQGVLYVSHGSRVPEATKEAAACISAVVEEVDVPLQQVCFLELAEPTIEQGVGILVSQGATRIAIVPVLLLSAGHYYKDIPREIERIQQLYPSIAFTYGHTLGVQDRIIDVLVERIEETNTPITNDAKIILVGRGSNYPQTKMDLEAIRGKLQTKLGFDAIEVSYLAVLEPSLDTMIDQSLKENRSQLFIVPYLWFTGVLIQSIQQKIEALGSTDKEIVLCQHLGDHPWMKQALKERVYECYAIRQY